MMTMHLRLLWHIHGLTDAKKWDGRTMTQTRALTRSISGLVVELEFKEGGQILHVFISEQGPSLLPTCLIQNVEPEPTRFAEGSLHSTLMRG